MLENASIGFKDVALAGRVGAILDLSENCKDTLDNISLAVLGLS